MTTQKRDYYEILNISKTASSDDIKKAYRQLAIRWHPDKNPHNKEQATEQFKLISEAYKVLADDNQRRIYDKYGHRGLNPQSESSASHDGFGFIDAQRIFQEFFSNGQMDDPFFRIFGSPMGPSRSQTSRNAFSNFLFGDSVFEDSFFRDTGFGMEGNLGRSNSFSQSFSSSMGGRGGSFKEEKTTTTIVNGRAVTRKETIVRHPDGRVERTVSSGRQLDDGAASGGFRSLRR